MSTSPFQADTETLIKESLRQIVRARATHPDLTGALELGLEDCTLEWDERRAPRVTAELTVKVPDNIADLSVLDPRTGVRVEIDCGYIRPGGDEDVYTIADLGLRSMRINRPENTISLSLASDEMLVVDASPAATGNVTGTSSADAIAKLIKVGVVPAPKITNTTSSGAITVDPVTDRWATIADIADRINAQVYDNGLREWFIAPTPNIAATPNATFDIGDEGTITGGQATLDRNDWFNYVFLRYKWTNTSGVAQEVRATQYVNAGPYSVTGPASKRIYMEEREVPTSQTVANAAALSILKRFLTRTRTYSLTAIAAYWVRCGDTVSVNLPSFVAPELHIVQRVRFLPLQGLMELDTRLPDNEISVGSGGTTDTTTPTPTPAPDPVPPAVQKYVSTWTATSSQVYKGDGTQNAFAGTDIVQGYFPGTVNGNQRSIVIFAGNSIAGSDEVGVTIAAALSGATVLKIEYGSYANHWWYNDGGTGRIGWYNGTTIPTTFSGGSPFANVNDWKVKSTRWANVTNSSFAAALKAGTSKGITFGPGVGSDPEYYGKCNGASASSNKPQLRITYSK